MHPSLEQMYELQKAGKDLYDLDEAYRATQEGRPPRPAATYPPPVNGFWTQTELRRPRGEGGFHPYTRFNVDCRT
ncbi:hypothetical protein VTJ49DRAFT_1556 [Mycothermus thermophilus]|uniref:Uncharacterized protein n=1 Tax=Humicola insolens TaxID=85995 RepID=A0ABR3VPI4_HUMIN